MVDYLDVIERIHIAIRIGESHFREFKTAIERGEGGEKPRDVKLIMRDIGETLVAFANADGGELIVGVEDDHKTTGIPHRNELIDAMIDARIND